MDRMVALGLLTLALGCSSDGSAGDDSTTSTTEVAVDDASVRESEEHFLELISQSSGIATDEMVEQGYDLCAAFAAQEEVSRDDLTVEWAADHDVDPARARWIADAAGRELCP